MRARKLEVLSKPAAARLLARASELDAARAAGATLTDLRAAAAEAGISSGAFDTALAEMRAAEHAPVPEATPRRRPRGRWVLVAGAAALILGAATTVVQRTPADAAAAMVDEAMALSAFGSKYRRPAPDDPRTVLGAAHDPWCRLVAAVTHAVGPITELWAFTSANTGWGFAFVVATASSST